MTTILRTKRIFFSIFYLLVCIIFQAICADQSGGGAQSTCSLKRIVGECDFKVCLVRDFLKKVKNGEMVDPVHNAWLLYGKGGTGKTETANQIASEAGVEIKEYVVSGIDPKKSIPLSEKESSKVANDMIVFYERLVESSLKEKKPVVVLINDVDLLGNYVFSTLRAQIDKNRDNPFIMTILTTRNIGRIERGLAGRCFSIEYKLPDLNKRQQIIEFFNKNKSSDNRLSDRNIKFLSLLTQGFSPKDLSEFVDNVYDSKENDYVFGAYKKTISENPHLTSFHKQNFVGALLCTAAVVIGAVLYKKVKYFNKSEKEIQKQKEQIKNKR